MKKTILITCIALVLLSFVSCNLDNNGILLNGLEKVPSDNKNRSFIGYDDTSSTMYYVTVDGLVKREVKSSDDDVISTPEIVISNDPIFTHYYQALGWLQGTDTIGYMTDSAGNNGGQYFYSIDPGTAAVTPLEVSGDHMPIVDVYMATDGARLVGDDGTVYSAEISGNKITVTQKHDSKGAFVSCTNGLIRYSDGKYCYEGQEISGLSGTVKAFATGVSNSYAITTSGSSFIIYSISGGSATKITTITGGDNNEFPCFVDSSGNLYFLYYRGTRSSSIVYKVSSDDKTVKSRDLHKNNIMAEAFVQGVDNKIYMLSKDNNMFVVTI